MAMPRGHTPPPISSTRSTGQPGSHSSHSIRPVHGDNDAYGPYAYGGRARLTVPMPYWPPFDDDIELPMRARCQNCRGSGVLAGRETRCPMCRRGRYTPEQVAAMRHFGFHNRRVSLPCRCEVLERDLIFVRPRCHICEGDGYLYRYIRWGDFIREMYGPDEEMDEQTTAALRALRRASAHEQTPQPMSPIPTPQGLSNGLPQGERVTPQIGPHLAPMAPPPAPPDDIPSRF